MTAEPTLSPTLAALQNLVDVVAQLRSPVGGCPWDLAQTPTSLAPYIIEEAYETVDALRSGDPSAIAEELGDLLLQVILQAQIASESGAFNLAEVAQGIAQKLVRRHPHVFAPAVGVSLPEATGTEPITVEAVRQTWEEIKAAEKGLELAETQRLSAKLSRAVRQLPPLTAALKISQKAATVGFEWDDLDGVWTKFQEELAELHEAIARGDVENQQEELGDLLFSTVQVARWCGLDPGEALHSTNQKFVDRLALMEAALGDRALDDCSIDELDTLWQQAKHHLRSVST